MPKGPFGQWAPKSGWRLAAKPIDWISAAEFGSTAARSTAVFHGLLFGRTRLPPRLAPDPRPTLNTAASGVAGAVMDEVVIDGVVIDGRAAGAAGGVVDVAMPAQAVSARPVHRMAAVSRGAGFLTPEA